MDLMSLSAKLTLDSSQYERGLDKAKGGASDFGKSFKRLLGGLAIGAGLKKSFDMVVKLTKNAVVAYAEYEQLVGGVETLYGSSAKSFEEYANTASDSMYKMGQSGEDVKKLQEELIKAGYDLGNAGADGIYGPKTKAAFDAYAKAGGQLVRDAYNNIGSASETVLDNAWRAFETAGLSANDYMSTVTSFSASLLQSLGGDTEKAAQYADMAIIDMADNANKMDTSMESIQNAYRGFAKQNYTMLDNLKLGYGGTKQEMQRLLSDAEKLTGKKYDLSNYADIVEAIHAIQTEIGITGTTAEEAEHTIQGSTNSMKSAWQNMLVAFASGKDVKKAFKGFTKSVRNVIKNVTPVVKQALAGISDFIGEIGPVLVAELPGLISELLPGLIGAVGNLIKSVAQALPGILVGIGEAVKTAVGSLGDWLNANVPILGQAFGLITSGFEAAFTGITTLWTDTIQPKLEEIASFFTGESGLFTEIQNAIDGATGENGIDWMKLFEGLTSINLGGIIADLFTAVGTDVSEIAAAFSGIFTADNFANAVTIGGDFGSAVIDAISGAIEGAGNAVTSITAAIGTVISNAITTLTSEEYKAAAEGAAENIMGSIVDGLKAFGGAITNIAGAVKDVVVSALSPENINGLFGEEGTFTGIGQKIIDGIVDAIGTAWESGKSFASTLIEMINGVDWAGATETLTTAATGLIDQLFSGLTSEDFSGWAGKIGELLGSAMSAVSNAGAGIAEAISNWILSGDLFVTLYNAANTIVSGLWEFVKNLFTSIWDNSIIVQKVKGLIEEIEGYFDRLSKLLGLDSSVGTPDDYTHTGTASPQTVDEWMLPPELQSDKPVQMVVDPELAPDATTGLSTALGEVDTTAMSTAIGDAGTTGGIAAATGVQGALDGIDVSLLEQVIASTGGAAGPRIASEIQSSLASGNYRINVSANVSGLPGGVEKHAKSMFGGTILRGATVFGANANGQPLVGGEAGLEAIVGVNSLSAMIQSSVNNAVGSVLSRLDKLVAQRGNSVVAQVYLDGRELSNRMTEHMNRSLGSANEWQRSGHA